MILHKVNTYQLRARCLAKFFELREQGEKENKEKKSCKLLQPSLPPQPERS